MPCFAFRLFAHLRGKCKRWWSCQILSVEVSGRSQQLDVEGLLLALIRQGWSYSSPEKMLSEKPYPGSPGQASFECPLLNILPYWIYLFIYFIEPLGDFVNLFISARIFLLQQLERNTDTVGLVGDTCRFSAWGAEFPPLLWHWPFSISELLRMVISWGLFDWMITW